MNSKNVKLIRGQVRQVVQEVLTQELVNAVRKQVQDHVSAQLKQMADSAESSLAKLNDNQRDMQSYLTRVVEQLTPVKPSDSTPPPAETL